MFSFLYNVSIFIYLIFQIPKMLFEYIKKRKRFPAILERLGLRKMHFTIPNDAYLIWVHSVSLGETKASLAYLDKIKDSIPNCYLIASSTTTTGLNEAKKNLPFAKHHVYLPVDFSWIFNKLFKEIKPKLLILTETDYWYQMLKQAKKHGAKILLINGKLSESSFKRFKRVKFFANRLFCLFDKLCVQNKEYKNRFEILGVDSKSIEVTGNLKFHPHIELLDQAYTESWKKHFAISPNQTVITIASTHDPEEKLLLESLQKVWSHLSFKILLAPRHPERITQISKLLNELNIPFQKMSEISNDIPRTEKLILIDQMGVLPLCYKLSDLAIIGGSFVSHVGGHNVLEPIFYDIPVFFGPHMQSQKDMKKLITNHRCGQEVTIETLDQAILQALENPNFLGYMKTHIHSLKESLQNSLEFTWEATSRFL